MVVKSREEPNINGVKSTHGVISEDRTLPRKFVK